MRGPDWFGYFLGRPPNVTPNPQSTIKTKAAIKKTVKSLIFCFLLASFGVARAGLARLPGIAGYTIGANVV